MKITLSSLLTATLLSLSLVPSFGQTASVTEGCAPLLVEFSAPAGLNTFFWDFGNGNNSVLEDPAETFTEPGVYEVGISLGNGQPILGTVTITVYEKPDLSFAADPAGGCAPLLTQFSNDSEVGQGVLDAGISWNWNFGDGETAQTEAPSHTYQNQGSYNVSLQMISGLTNCSVVETETGFITVSGVEANFTVDPLSSCEAPVTINFTNLTQGDGLTFDWDFGNGEAAVVASPDAVTYTEDGNYEVLLTVTDDNGCVSSTTRTISVGLPLANFTIPDTVCLDQPVQLANTSSPGTYRWEFGPNAEPSLSTEVAPEVSWSVTGDVEVRLVVTSPNGECVNDISRTIYVQEVDASFTTDPTFLCSDPFEFTYTPAEMGAGTTYAWLFPDSTGSSEAMPTYTVDVDTNQYAQSGLREMVTQLTLTTSAGCSATFSRTDTLFQAYALFMPDVDNGCAPLAVTFSDSSSAYSNIVSYTYIYGDGNTATFNSDEDHTYTFDQAGEYDVLLVIEDANGCTDTSYAVRIDVGEAITPDFTADIQDVCPGETVTLTTTTQDERIDAWHFTTDDGRSSHCYNEPNLSWEFVTEAKEYDVTLTVEYNGCYTETTKQNFINIKGPIAKIYYEMDCSAPLEYTFRDSSSAATDIIWDFGDGETASGSEVVHTYAETGDYIVTLTAANAGSGCAASVDTALVCVRNPEAKFELDPMICLGQQVDLDGSQSVDVNADCYKGYTWLFDISNRPVTTQDSVIEWSFSVPGEERVRLEVEDINGCKDTATVFIKIYQVQAAFSVDKSLICIPSQVIFTDESTADTTITSYSWDFGDGVGMSSGMNPTYTYNSLAGVPPGEGITVTLTLEDALGCPGEATQTISVYTPNSTITATDTQICAGDDVRFSASDFTAGGSNLNFQWTLNGESLGTTRNIGPITFDQGGNYQVVLDFVEQGTGCAGQTTQLIQVQEYPVPMVTIDAPDPDNICTNSPTTFSAGDASGQVLTYQWSFSDGQSATAQSPQLTFPTPGNVEYTLNVSTLFGCAAAADGSFAVVGPTGNFNFSPTELCIGDEVTFELVDTNNVASWTWTFGDGSQAEDESPTTHTYNDVPTTGTRTVALVLQDENGCESIPITRTLFIGGGPVEVEDGFACAGDTIILSAGNLRPGSTYSWTPANVIINPTAANPRAVVTETTTFTVMITSSLGCVSEGSGTIEVLPAINWAGQNIVACTQDSITLPEPENPGGVYTFTWSPSGPTILPNADMVTTVFLTIQDPANCFDNNVFEYNVSLAEGSFRIPNVFTPDGDDLNDEFKVYTAEGNNLDISTFKVYNRWGKVVYDGSGAGSPSWDGRVDGEPAPSEVYTYFIELEVPQCEQPIQKRGDVTLLR
jgi:gliding motility-associated-like protein